MIDLDRFLLAQENCYEIVLSELSDGKKTSHWMWFIFPQVSGLGSSSIAERYAIKDISEAKAYLDNLTLKSRLTECIEIVIQHYNLSAQEIFGFPDVLKFKSCLTLFYECSEDNAIYKRALHQFYQGELDLKTIQTLRDNGDNP